MAQIFESWDFRILGPLYASPRTLEPFIPGTLYLNCSGQATVEYLLAAILAALVIGAAFSLFFSALRGYYGLLTFMVGLPIP